MSEEFSVEHLSTMDPVTLYAVLKLRTDVFVVEQDCAYPELDGRDLEPGSLQVRAESDGRLTAALRILVDDDALRIGRVVAHPDARGTGVAGRLFAYALEQCGRIDPQARIVLDAQAPLQGWYESFGFTVTGGKFLEDGIPHIPMEK